MTQFPDGFKRMVTVATANVGTGTYDRYNNENTEFSEFWNACVASGSIPGVFPPHFWNDQVYMDGGTVVDVNIDSAIE